MTKHVIIKFEDDEKADRFIEAVEKKYFGIEKNRFYLSAEVMAVYPKESK
jgi:hypothetical protein